MTRIKRFAGFIVFLCSSSSSILSVFKNYPPNTTVTISLCCPTSVSSITPIHIYSDVSGEPLARALWSS